jgi:hypothetical protein
VEGAAGVTADLLALVVMLTVDSGFEALKGEYDFFGELAMLAVAAVVVVVVVIAFVAAVDCLIGAGMAFAKIGVFGTGISTDFASIGFDSIGLVIIGFVSIAFASILSIPIALNRRVGDGFKDFSISRH